MLHTNIQTFLLEAYSVQVSDPMSMYTYIYECCIQIYKHSYSTSAGVNVSDPISMYTYIYIHIYIYIYIYIYI